MKRKLLFALVTIFSLSVNAQEKIRISDNDFLSSLSTVKTQPINAEVEKSEISYIRVGKYVTLTGYINLSGRSFVPQNGGFISVNLSGWAQLNSSDYKIKTDNQYVTVYVSLWANPNQYVSQTVYPNISFRVYKEGKYIATVYSSGSVNVGGWVSGNYVNLSGSGYLNASVYIPDEE